MRRHLMKASGEKLPAWFKSHAVCWFSPSREGVTTESVRASRKLTDLSGKGNDLEISADVPEANFWISNGELKFSTTREYYTRGSWAYTNVLKALQQFTLIGRGERYFNNSNTERWAMKGNAFECNEYAWGQFSKSFGGNPTDIAAINNNILFVMTPQEEYNIGSESRLAIVPGGKEDKVSRLELCVHASDNYGQKWGYRDVLLFDRILNDEQVAWVVENLINN